MNRAAVDAEENDTRHYANPGSTGKARTLAATLLDAWNDVLLYRTLATLRLDVRTFDTVDGLRWTGPCTDFEDCCRRLQSPDLFVRTGYELGALYLHPNFPAQIGLDNHDYLSGLTWSDVGPHTASANGALNEDDCTPNCASGTYHTFPVQVLASDPRQCTVTVYQAGGASQRVQAYVFGSIAVRALSGSPATLAHGPLFAPPC